LKHLEVQLAPNTVSRRTIVRLLKTVTSWRVHDLVGQFRKTAGIGPTLAPIGSYSEEIVPTFFGHNATPYRLRERLHRRRQTPQFRTS